MLELGYGSFSGNQIGLEPGLETNQAAKQYVVHLLDFYVVCRCKFISLHV